VAEPQSSPVPEGTAPTPPGAPVDVPARTPGWREVLLIAAIVVGIVFAFQIVTSLLPASLQDVVFRTPLTIIVLIAGTIGLLAWIARRPSA
jgi:hypothetical protein